MFPIHRILVGVILIGNTIAFAGVDPISRAVTAGLAVLLVLFMAKTPVVPRVHLWCAIALGALAVFQLISMPEGLRSRLQAGYVEVLADEFSVRITRLEQGADRPSDGRLVPRAREDAPVYEPTPGEAEHRSV